MMSLGPLAGLLGAALASLSAFKWMLAGFIIIMVIWVFVSSKNTRNALDSRALKDLIKSATQWNTRSIQDKNPIIGLMNANYAMAYLNVARSVGSDVEIEKTTGLSIDDLLKDIEKTQTEAIDKLTSSCPTLSMSNSTSGWFKKK